MFMFCFFGVFVLIDCQTILLPSRLYAGQNNTLVLISKPYETIDATIQINDGLNDILPSNIRVRFEKGKFSFYR